MIGSSLLALPQVFLTASQISTAKSISVCVKVSGEYSYLKVVPPFSGLLYSSTSSRTILVCLTAKSMVCSLLLPKTASRKMGEVALYRCRMTFLAPLIDSKVLRMSSSL